MQSSVSLAVLRKCWGWRTAAISFLVLLLELLDVDEEIFLAYREAVDFSQQCEHFTNFANHYVYFVFGVTTAGRFVLSLEHYGDVFDDHYQPEQPLIRLTQAVMEQKWLPILNWW